MRFAIESIPKTRDTALPAGGAGGLLQRQHGVLYARRYAVRQQRCELTFQVFKLGADMRTQPGTQRTMARAPVSLTLAGVKPRTRQLDAPEDRAILGPMTTVTPKTLLAVGAHRPAGDDIASLGIDKRARCALAFIAFASARLMPMSPSAARSIAMMSVVVMLPDSLSITNWTFIFIQISSVPGVLRKVP